MSQCRLNYPANIRFNDKNGDVMVLKNEDKILDYMKANPNRWFTKHELTEEVLNAPLKGSGINKYQSRGYLNVKNVLDCNKDLIHSLSDPRHKCKGNKQRHVHCWKGDE